MDVQMQDRRMLHFASSSARCIERSQACSASTMSEPFAGCPVLTSHRRRASG